MKDAKMPHPWRTPLFHQDTGYDPELCLIGETELTLQCLLLVVGCHLLHYYDGGLSSVDIQKGM